ncbi:MAG: helix-turn-helix transcriptional regulator [Rhodobacteraceae bacterium]|nr:helix-turn-helix transcriptional regulator [Paracoccaceae bacterium]
MQRESLVGVYEQLMSAAVGEGSFSTAIASMTEAFDAAGGVVFEMNRKTGAISNWISPTLFAGEDNYSQHINSINPRMRYSLRHAPGHVIYEKRFIDETSMARNEFYDWLDREHGMAYFMGSRLYDEGDISVFHSVEFLKKQGHSDREDVEAFRKTAHALGNAWRLAKRSDLSGTSGSLNGWTPNHLPWSIIAVSSVGRVVLMNDAARALIERGDALNTTDGVLGAGSPDQAKQFQMALKNAFAGAGADLLLRGKQSQTQLVTQVVPVSALRADRPTSIAALVYVWDPSAGTPDLGAALQQLWDLTPAEAALTGFLVTGESLAIAADTLGISRNTARNQLQSIFAKTGTNRQAELARLVFGVINRQA